MAHLQHELVAAVHARDEAQVIALLNLGAMPDAAHIIAERCVVPVLITACNNGDEGIVKALLRSGADPNASMETVHEEFIFSCPALITAMHFPRIVEALLISGARADAVADWGIRRISAIDYAHGDRAMQNLLVSYGARAA